MTDPSATLTFAYDPGGRQTTAVTSGPSGQQLLVTLTYGFDNVGNRTSMTDSLANVGRTTYSYDTNNQLTTVTVSRAETYTYDSTGNRTLTGYSTGIGNWLVNTTGVTYTYDAEGNLISKNGTGGNFTYSYDFRNRLTNVTLNGTLVATYTYDALDRRIGFNISGSQTWTVYDGANTYADFASAGAVAQTYLYGPAVDELLARTNASGSTTSWYLADKNGTIHDIIDNAGPVPNILNHVVYDSFGQIVTETSAASGDRFKYAHMQYDGPTIKIYYDRARSYNPATGRFLQEDPLGLSAGDVNVYRYVGNGPTNFVDPSGLRYAVAETDATDERQNGSSGKQAPKSDDCCCCCCCDAGPQSQPAPQNTPAAAPPSTPAQPPIPPRPCFAPYTPENIRLPQAEAGLNELGNGLYNVGAGIGHFFWDLGAVPYDFFAGTEHSYYGSATADALRNGFSLAAIEAEVAANIGTLGLKGLKDSAGNYIETGDPTQFQQYSGSFLAGSLTALAGERLTSPRAPGAVEVPPEVPPPIPPEAGPQNAAPTGLQSAPSRGTFPQDPANLLPDLPRDPKGYIYPNSCTRIRPEQHPLQPGETYCPRHHGQHYHVEIRADTNKSYNNPKNCSKIKPPGYAPGQGTGFLPGEQFP